MNFVEQAYQEIIDQLKQGGRGLKAYGPQEIELIKEAWQKAIAQSDHEQAKKILCLVDHAENIIPGLASLFCQTIQTFKVSELQVLTLGASSQHIITHAGRQGERVPEEFSLALEEILESPLSDEVFEWVLRTIEQYDMSGIRFRERVLKLRPGFVARIFNSHQQNSFELIQLLEQRWSPLVRKK